MKKETDILVQLMPRPNPVEHKQVHNWRKVPRRIWCRQYSACLDLAARLDWDGFTCNQCQVDDELTDDEKMTEALAKYEQKGLAGGSGPERKKRTAERRDQGLCIFSSHCDNPLMEGSLLCEEHHLQRSSIGKSEAISAALARRRARLGR